MKENLSFTVKKDIQATFAALTDLDQLARFGKGQVRMEDVPGRPRAGAGSAVLLKTSNPALREVLCETLEWEPPSKCVRRLAIPDLPITVGLAFSEAGGRTTVTVDLELTPQSMLYKMMLPMLAQKVKAEKEEAVKRLQKELDSA